ncbi:MAG TPA: efflux RND transporter periplasmic adaptor subunit [Fibrobacteria bacterium]|nr:efflux RND transporter periplasmic adaptor subunit [Fibrobacteria bacterium]
MNPIKDPSPTVERLEFLQRLSRLFRPEAPAASFWPGYLEAAAMLCEARSGLIVRSPGEARLQWEQVAAYPPEAPAAALNPLLARIEDAAAALANKPDEEAGVLLGNLDHTIAAATLVVGSDGKVWLALLFLGEPHLAVAQEKLQALVQIRDLPAQCQALRSQMQAQARTQQMAGVLDLASLLHDQDRFLAAAMILCNELAARHRCDRVSVGWLQKGYMRLVAMSHSDSPEQKMEASRQLELAMEETLDQDAEIAWPQAKDMREIARDHGAYARAQDSGHLFSLPLRAKQGPLAVVLLERRDSPFGEAEQQLFRIACNHATPWLAQLKRKDRWAGARAWDWAKARAGKLVGFEHTAPKLLAAVLAVALAFVCFVPVPYRIEAPAILRTDHVTHLTAPFDGHIEHVAAKIGDEVSEGQELLRLDKNELLLREAAAEAEIRRYEAEAEKARAANELAEMRISQSLQEQAAARLDLIRYRLSQSTLRSPYSGILVEGDLEERIGSPVKQGETLFKVARIADLHAELEIPEADVDRVSPSLPGRIALASRPDDRQAFNIASVEPAAQVGKEGNVFLARGAVAGAPPQWWRPGMTGVAKVSAGRETLLWIGTHKTLDFLRLHLW